MNEEHCEWKRMCFKNNKVWVAVDPQDSPRIEKGKVLIKYQLDQPHEYWIHPESLRPLPEKGGCKPHSAGKKQSSPPPQKKKAKRNKTIDPLADDKETIHVYTDGASSGNPGPAGIGIFLQYGMHEKEISQYIGVATNNIAELEAIRVGLAEIKNPELPVRVYTDSSYALGLLTLGWKPKKNQDLVKSIKMVMGKFKDLTFVKVQGHAGNKGNEAADRLATGAIKERS
ncbi:MAG: ribonuclease H [Thermodesulfobacteriota bacterium]